MIAECTNQKIKIKKKYIFLIHLEFFYHAMTQFIGFKNFGDECKLMGLAPYGKPIYLEKLNKNLFIKSKNLFKLNLSYFEHDKINFNYSHIG